MSETKPTQYKKRVRLYSPVRYSIIAFLGMLIGLAAYYVLRKVGY